MHPFSPSSLFLRIGAVLLLCMATFASGKVFISEVMWPGTDLSTSDEWVELDTTGSGQSVDGWSLTGLSSTGIETILASFGSGAVVLPGKYPIISHFSATGSRILQEPMLVSPKLTLANTKLLLRLRDNAGAIIDQADDGIGNPMAGLNPKAPEWKASMERVSGQVSGSGTANWRTASTFLGFDDGAPLYGTPGFANGTGPSTDTTAPLEATNVGASAVESGTGLTLTLRWKPSVSLDLQHQLLRFSPAMGSGSSSVLLPATASGFVTGDLQSGLLYHIDLVSIDRNSHSSSGVLILLEPLQKAESSNISFIQSSVSSSVISEHNFYSESSISSLSTTSQSSSLLASSSSVVAIESSSTSSVSAYADSGSLRLSEILPNPFGSDDNQWIELSNPTAFPVTLSGWTLKIASSDKKYDLANIIDIGFYLGSGGILTLPKKRTNLLLSHQGGTIQLLHNSQVVDSMTYPLLPDGVSFGRHTSGNLVPFCAPTPGKPNDDRWSPSLTVQSGNPIDQGKVTINVDTVMPEGVSEPVSCTVTFGDGSMSTACNPPSHTYSSVGSYLLQLDAVNYCGTTVKRSLNIQVLPAQNSSSIHSSSSAISSGSPSGTTGVSVQTRTSYPHLILTSALPNPSGKDDEHEWFMIGNPGQETALLSGWSVRINGRSSALDVGTGSIAPGATTTISSSTRSFQLPNASGSLLLLNPLGQVESVLQWKDAQENRVYTMKTTQKWSATVSKVIDGDTIDVVFDQTKPLFMTTQSARVRFLGIDAPEISNANDAISVYGYQTKDFVRTLIENKKVELEFDTDTYDIYGRLLAYITPQTGEMMQRQILKQGLATVLRKYDFSKKDEFIKIEEEAKSAGRGHWGHGSVLSASGMLIAPASQGGESLYNGLQISEIYASPATGEAEWIELWNRGEEAVSLTGLMLDDAEGGSKPWSFSGSTIIAPHGYLTFYGKQTHLALNNSGDDVRLLLAGGSVLDQVAYPSLKAGQSYAWMEETGSWCITTQPTEESLNICVPVAPKATKASSASKGSTAKKATAKTVIRVAYADDTVAKSSGSSTSSGSSIVESLLSSLNSSQQSSEISAEAPSKGVNIVELLLSLVLSSGGAGYVGWFVGKGGSFLALVRAK